MALTQVKTSGIADDAVTLDKQAAGTDGQVITYDASGNPVAVGPGTDGQVLTSTGAGSPPAFEDAVSEGTQVKSTGESGGTKFLREDGDGTCSWQTLPSSGATLSGSTNNTVVTVTGANAMTGEANLTFDGNHLTQTIDANAEGFNQTAAGAHYIDNTAEANLSSGDNPILRTTATWNGTTVAQIKYNAGADTTNKDDGYLSFNTSAADDLSERMRITSSGTVGIGETAPLGKLHVKTGDASQGAAVAWGDDLVVEGSGDSGITILSGNAADGSLIFGDNGDADVGRVVYNHSSNFLGFDANAGSRMKVKGDGNVEIVDGDLIIGTSGHGIDFSATSDTGASNASMSNELLDDYEEGSWEPAAYSGCTSVGHFGSHYVKIGNLCSVWAYIHQVAGATSSSVFKVDGLPFTAHSQDSYPGSCVTHGVDNTAGGAMYVNPVVEGNSDRLKLMGSGDENAWYQLNGDHVGNGDTIMIGITYRTA